MKSWCKVASNLDSHPKIRRAGRNGREVFLFALRRNAEPDNPVPGRLPAAMLEPWYLADQLMMSEAEAVTGVTSAVTAGLLVQDGDSWIIQGWEGDWGKKPVEGKERTAKWRDSKKTTKSVTDVTSHDVTESHGDESDALDQKRREKKGATPRADLVLVQSEPAPPPKPAADDSIRPAVDAFDAYFRDANGGAKPTWGPKQIAMLKTLAKRHTVAEVVRRIESLRSKPPSFPPQPWDLATFVSNADRCAAQLTHTWTAPIA